MRKGFKTSFGVPYKAKKRKNPTCFEGLNGQICGSLSIHLIDLLKFAPRLSKNLEK
uniref:Uncharacterized protein n=1 Tax=Strongyloides papillosus TaxID=174720 RepID=A0A0N5CAQ8_STREA